MQDFFDGKELNKRLVAAYLPGTKVTENDFFDLKLMEKPDETGGFVTWNTFKILKNDDKYNFTIDKEWLKDALCSNPITWDDKNTTAYNDHKGFLYLNQKVFPKTVKIESIDNKIFVKLPKMDILKTLLLSSVKDYHKADVNLFWEDIRTNSIERSKNYLSKIN